MDKTKFNEVFATFEKEYKEFQAAKSAKHAEPDKKEPDSDKDDAMANMDKKMCAMIDQVYSNMYNMMSNVRSYMYSMEDSHYKHANDGHLPKIKGAAAMSKCLKALGLDGDYEVAKSQIYASKDNSGLKFVVDLKAKNEKKD